MEDRKRDIYGDNYLDDYPAYWDTSKFAAKEKINTAALTYGAGLALAMSFVILALGLLWAQAVDSVTLNYSLVVDLSLAGSVLFGSFKGAARAKTMGLIHGALIGLAYSVVGILLLAVLLPINWAGALETVLIAVFLGCIGGIAGVNYAASRQTKEWRQPSQKQEFFDDYDEFDLRH